MMDDSVKIWFESLEQTRQCKSALTNEVMYQDMIDDDIAECDLERWVGEGYTISDLYILWVYNESMPD